ncbi:hypothetical protein ACLOJK_026566 [Asimina triloba]
MGPLNFEDKYGKQIRYLQMPTYTQTHIWLGLNHARHACSCGDDAVGDDLATTVNPSSFHLPAQAWLASYVWISIPSFCPVCFFSNFCEAYYKCNHQDLHQKGLHVMRLTALIPKSKEMNLLRTAYVDDRFHVHLLKGSRTLVFNDQSRSNRPKVTKPREERTTSPQLQLGVPRPAVVIESYERGRRWRPNQKQREVMEQVYKVASDYQVKDLVAVCMPQLGEEGLAPEAKVFNWFKNRIAKEKRLRKERSERGNQINMIEMEEENAEEEERWVEVKKKEEEVETLVEVEVKEVQVKKQEEKPEIETKEKTGVEIYLDQSGLICVRHK